MMHKTTKSSNIIPRLQKETREKSERKLNTIVGLERACQGGSSLPIQGRDPRKEELRKHVLSKIRRHLM